MQILTLVMLQVILVLSAHQALIELLLDDLARLVVWILVVRLVHLLRWAWMHDSFLIQIGTPTLVRLVDLRLSNVSIHFVLISWHVFSLREVMAL